MDSSSFMSTLVFIMTPCKPNDCGLQVFYMAENDHPLSGNVSNTRTSLNRSIQKVRKKVIPQRLTTNPSMIRKVTVKMNREDRR